MKRISLRVYLGRMILLSILPLLALAIALSWMHFQSISQARAHDVQDRAKNIATAIGNQVRTQIEGLELLADSPLLNRPLRIEDFYLTALAFREHFGAHVILADKQLNMLLNTRAPLGTPLPKVPLPRSPGVSAVERAISEGRSAVSDIVDGPLANMPLLATVVPVRREGVLQHLLIGTTGTRRFQIYIDTLNIQADWSIQVLDGAGQVIAARRPAGFEPLAAEDAPAARVISGIPHTRWSVVLEPSRLAHNAPLWAAGGTLLASILAIGLASLLGARLAGRRLERAVSSLEGNEAVQGADITEFETVRQRLERTTSALRAGENRYRMMFKANPHPMWVFDRETLRILAVNDAAMAHYGYSEQEFLDLTIADIRPKEDLPRMQAAVDSPDHGELVHPGVFRHRRTDGSLIDVEITAHRLEFDGRPASMVMCIDVTERLRAEQKDRAHLLRMERSLAGTVSAISQMMALRDPYTAGHEKRVGKLAAAIAAEMGLDADTQGGLEIAGGVHDVGKMSVPSDILSKPGRLSSVEYEIVKTHSQQGHAVLKDIDFPWPVAEITYQHHERLDGSGYPRGLKGDAILREARILAVADTVEAMVSHRPYRAQLGEKAALEEIERGAGTLFDPAVVAACLRLFREKHFRIPE